jgi:hypothetical protein
MEETQIIIKGQVLSAGQSMTIRVALENFASDLISSGLGGDAHGKAMTDLYLKQIDSLRELIRMTDEPPMSEVKEIQDGLLALLEGKDKKLAIVAALSIAATTAHMIGMPKLELQKMLVHLCDKLIAEAKTGK